MTARNASAAAAHAETAAHPTANGNGARAEGLVAPYRRLADVFHDVLSEQSLEALLDRTADTLAELIPYDALHIYQADEQQRLLLPVLARGEWADEIMRTSSPFGQGITGWAVENREPVLSNRAHLDPRVAFVPGTPIEPEALITVPLIARGALKGALNVYRIGEAAAFQDDEFELVRLFGDAAALALDNAQVRARLEWQAQTDSLTGLYNHRYFHERLRSELTRASRTHESVAVLMFDIDDFKRVNDVYGHATGDQMLVSLAEIARATVRASDVVCRIGGEEFAVIMTACDGGDALALARRLMKRLTEVELAPFGAITLSIGVAQGPEHAMNPRELVACAEAAMMTAKAAGKNQTVLFDEDALARPDGQPGRLSDVRSLAHMKLLQSLAGKLNRLNDVRAIGASVANELRMLIDYHNCRVFLREGDLLVPVTFRGQLDAVDETDLFALACRTGEGITGHVAQTGEPMLVPNALECEHAVHVEGTHEIEESIAAVPLLYGSHTIGALVISKLGTDQFDEDDVRLLEVLAGHAAVALENARLYEAQRREATHAKALLEFADAMSRAPSLDAIGDEIVRTAARLLDATQSSLWLPEEPRGALVCLAELGYADDPAIAHVLTERVEPETAARWLDGRTTPFFVSREDAAACAGVSPDAGVSAVAVAPLSAGEGHAGWIIVRVSDGRLTADQLRLLEGLSYQASVALEKSRLYREQQESAEVANALLDFSRQLANADGMTQVLERVVELTARTLGCAQAALWLQDRPRDDLRMRAAYGFDSADYADTASRTYGVDVVRDWLDCDAPFILQPGDLAYVDGVPEHKLAQRFAVAPMRIEGGRIGAVVVTLGESVLDEQRMRLLAGLAHQVKLAIESASNMDTLERTFVETVEALANALEASDEYTSSHARWITDMALRVGSELRLDPKALKRLELGALFHDIGKIGIPTQILTKPGPLTDEERAIVERHPELGEKILEPIEQLAEVRPIVRACHERFDGRGYPDGKAEQEIPIESRVILVVDAFHAMTTDRPYRGRLPVEEACARLREAAGTQFDPGVVDAFLRLHDSGAIAPE